MTIDPTASIQVPVGNVQHSKKLRKNRINRIEVIPYIDFSDRNGIFRRRRRWGYMKPAVNEQCFYQYSWVTRNLPNRIMEFSSIDVTKIKLLEPQCVCVWKDYKRSFHKDERSVHNHKNLNVQSHQKEEEYEYKFHNFPSNVTNERFSFKLSHHPRASKQEN